ncbi:MAG: polysaccharide pyruvyl transferase family protein, partial [Lachnospiraceae bacterium]
LGLTWFNYKKFKKNKRFRSYNFKQEFYSESNAESVIVGSDEVFSIPVGINIMMFGHGLLTNKVISYAASFGQTDMHTLKKHHCENVISSGLRQFFALSVRDEHSADLVKLLTENSPEIVCDPVILYDFEKMKVSVRPLKKYLLLYSMDRFMIADNEIAAIKQFAQKKHLITVSVGTYHAWCDKNISCNCLEWLEYFRRAECVITDTFHGLVLSSITNRPMAVYVRSLNSNKLVDMLKRTGLSNRQIKIFDLNYLSDIFEQQIDFRELNRKIKEMREHSNNYLEHALSLCEKDETVNC